MAPSARRGGGSPIAPNSLWQCCETLAPLARACRRSESDGRTNYQSAAPAPQATGEVIKGEKRMTKNTLAKFAGALLTSVAAAALAPAFAADGAPVPAKRGGSTTPPSFYTDGPGIFSSPPMASGKYQVWAQALSFETRKAPVDLSAAKQQNFSLAAMTDPDRRWRQLPGELM